MTRSPPKRESRCERTPIGYAPVRHYLSPLQLRPGRSGPCRLQIVPRFGEIPVVSHRRAFLTNKQPTFIKVSKRTPLWVHELSEEGQGVWMTDLPEELQQIEDFLARAGVTPGRQSLRGSRVLVGGLGLGIVATRLAQEGAAVTVVERNRHIIKLCRPPDIPMTVIQGDIATYLRDSRHGPFGEYYLDTWQGTNEGTWWKEVMPLRRIIANRFGVVPVWCWAEDIMLGQVVASGTAHLASGSPAWYYKLLAVDTHMQEFVTTVGMPSWEKKHGNKFQKGGS